MSLLDDARRLLNNPPGTGKDDGWCYFCFEDKIEHDPDCPWLAMPEIVAALEATQALVDAHAQFGLWRVVDDPKELGDRQQAALTALWELGIRPSDPMQTAIEG